MQSYPDWGKSCCVPLKITKPLRRRWCTGRSSMTAFHTTFFAEVRPGILTRLKANNERLELLGDKVFGLLTTNFLYLNSRALSEGQMSRSVSSIVSRKSAGSFCRYVSRLCAPFTYPNFASQQCGLSISNMRTYRT